MGRSDGPASSVRGRLCDVLLPGLCEGEADAVMRRLGERASLDEPVFGGSRQDALRAHVEKLIDWMKERAARFEKSRTIIGTSVDVTEGTLFFGPQGARQRVPTAIVVERKREREVDVRLHFLPASWTGKVKGPTLPKEPIELAGVVAEALAALGGKKHEPCFEERARLRDGRGQERDALAGEPRDLVPTGIADDLRVAAVEVRRSEHAGVVVLERGEGGMIRAARLYGDV